VACHRATLERRRLDAEHGTDGTFESHPDDILTRRAERAILGERDSRHLASDDLGHDACLRYAEAVGDKDDIHPSSTGVGNKLLVHTKQVGIEHVRSIHCEPHL
jgi:hypothetical protein